MDYNIPRTQIGLDGPKGEFLFDPKKVDMKNIENTPIEMEEEEQQE